LHINNSFCSGNAFCLGSKSIAVYLRKCILVAVDWFRLARKYVEGNPGPILHISHPKSLDEFWRLLRTRSLYPKRIKPSGSLYKMCNLFLHEFRVIPSSKGFQLICYTATLSPTEAVC
jgi:hypothetical protein